MRLSPILVLIPVRFVLCAALRYALLSKPSLSCSCRPLTPGFGLGAGSGVTRGEKHTVRRVATGRNGLARHMESLVGLCYRGGSCQIAAHSLKPLQFACQGYTVIPRLTKIIRSGITFVSRNVISP